jgi:hypothetical protein
LKAEALIRTLENALWQSLWTRVRDYDADDDDESVIVTSIYLRHFVFLKLCARWCSF